MRCSKWCVLSLLLWTSPAHADYRTATIVAIDEPTAQGQHYVIACTAGDAGEDDRKVDLVVRGDVATKDAFAAVVWAACDGQARNKTLAKALTVGLSIARPVVAEPPSQPDPIPPTPQQVWFSKLAQLFNVRVAVEAGIVPSDDANYLALLKIVVDGFKSEYVNAIGWSR